MHNIREGRILIADDAATVTKLLSVALTNEGFSVLVADNGVEAFELGCQRSIDLAIVDHHMPGLLGIEVLEKWKVEGLGFPVIMLSGVDDEGTIVDSLRMGAVDFVRKPFLVAELTARVDVALRSRTQ